MFSKILIANRGEIACRVIRTAHRMGFETVAVYSDADVTAPHVRMAGEAVHIGPAAAQQSYLRIDGLLEAAARTGAQAVHPGYGFLSERADFAQACADAGLIFIGPPPSAIRAMGDKAQAKRLMLEAGVPCAAGYLGEDQSDDVMAAQALRIGFPLLVKAVAGGGGRGMRLVDGPAELPAALDGARREAQAAFGDGRLMLERLVQAGRHIEVQVLADAHGHVLHLGERDCSTQRRRQKLIEETPSPVVDEALRDALGADAVAAARAVGYVGAGTVEFILGADGRHLFLEMNTRLQVEHPVTECVTGLDLVEWQLRVAAGEALPLRQADVRLQGHAIEVRLVTEDPYTPGAPWTPQTGTVRGWDPAGALEAAGGALRIDHALATGLVIGPHYDGMVAKFIAHGRTRADAVRVLVGALDAAPLFGPGHNARLLRDLLQHPSFTDGTLTTDTLDTWAVQGHALLQRPVVPEWLWRVAAALRAGPAPALRPASVAGFDLTLRCGDETRQLRAPIAGVTLRSLPEPGDRSDQALLLQVEVDGVHLRVPALLSGREVWLAWQAQVFRFEEPSAAPAAHTEADASLVRSPVAGMVGQVLVRPGDRISPGQALVSVEAMKMQMWQHAAAAGTVRTVMATAGAPVAAGALLVELEIDP